MIQLGDIALLQYFVIKRFQAVHSDFKLIHSKCISLDDKRHFKTFFEMSIPSEFKHIPRLIVFLESKSCDILLGIRINGKHVESRGYGFNFKLKFNTINEILLNIYTTIIESERMIPQSISDVCDTSYNIQSLLSQFERYKMQILSIKQHYTHPKSKYIELLEVWGTCDQIDFKIEFCFSETGDLVIRYLNQYEISIPELSTGFSEIIDYDLVFKSIHSVCEKYNSLKSHHLKQS